MRQPGRLHEDSDNLHRHTKDQRRQLVHSFFAVKIHFSGYLGTVVRSIEQ